MKTIRTTYMPNEKFNAESADRAAKAWTPVSIRRVRFLGPFVTEVRVPGHAAAGLCTARSGACSAKVVAPKKEAWKRRRRPWPSPWAN